MHLCEMHAPCLCCISARLVLDGDVLYKTVGLRKSLGCVLINAGIQINGEKQKSL